jgi:hypothetical protein
MKKLFKIIGSIILILIIAVVVFLYFVSTPLPEGQQGAKAEALTDKFKQPSIKQLGILPPPFLLALEKSPLSLGQKTQLSSSSGAIRKYFIMQTIEGIAYENGKKLTDSEKQML